MCDICNQPMFYDPDEDREICAGCEIDRLTVETEYIREIKEEMRRFYLN